ncbi:MAG: ATP-binding protein [Gammaproteobacteria bacterium]|nr:ATP-binding protein [Gammaproteobacteria bacterium]
MRHSLEGKLSALVAALLLASVALAIALHRLTGSVWLSALFTTTLILPVSIYLLHKLMSPVNRLVQALSDGVSSLKDNDFSVSISRQRSDELGDLVSTYNDLGEVLRRERQDILQRELLLDTVIQSTPLALLLTDVNDTVIMGNTAARELFNGGRKLEGYAFAALRAHVDPAFEQALAKGADGLFTLEGGDEPQTWHLSTRRFLLNGKPHRLYLFKQLTREISRQEVATWKKVIRVIAHELNNSLAPISSLANSGRVVATRPDAGKLETIFSTIEERAQHLKSFIEGYARFAKLPQPRPGRVAWSGFLESLEQTVPFTLDGEPPQHDGWFDPTQLEQVLINLLKNAHESGSAADSVSVRVSCSPNGSRIQVLDRGNGMSEQVLASAMLPFYSTKRSGTGLGLTLSREIVEAHGGRMGIANREGGGVAVDLWLPGSR